MQLYRGIIKQALNISWKSKYLWFFGLFAALLGNGGEYEILFQPFSADMNSNIFSGLAQISQTGIFTAQGLRGIGNLLISEPISVIVAILIILVILSFIGFVIWLVNVSQAVLVKNTLLKIGDKKTSFKESLDGGAKKFWPVFAFNLIARVIVLISLSLVGYVVLWGNSFDSLTSGIIYTLIFILFIPLAMSFSFIVKYGIGYSVINDQKFAEALKSGWELFKKNWLISLEMAFILYFLNIIVALLFIVVALVLAIPLAFLAFAASTLSMVGMFMFIVFVGIILFLVFLVATGSFVATFQISSWSLLFIELIGKGGKSKIARIFAK